jgi:uncharacterized membrane protein YqhA
MLRLEAGFESLLWRSRLFVLVAVICCALLALVSFVIGAVDTVKVLFAVTAYAGINVGADAPSLARAEIVAGMVKAVDAFLIGAILFVVAFGLYELFVGRIKAAENDEVAQRLLLIRSLDDLKVRLARLILLVLVVEFFGVALKLSFNGVQDLVLLAAGVLLVSLTLYVSGRDH